MKKRSGLRAFLVPPYNSLNQIMETVGGMRRGDIIQAEVPCQSRVDTIHERMNDRFPATDYMLEDFIHRGHRYIYIYICTKNDFAKGGFDYE